MPPVHCGECKTKFSKVGNLRAHVKRKHPDKLNILAPKKTYASTVTCTECNSSFVNTSNLNVHIRTKHPDLHKDKAQCEICKSENKPSAAFCQHVKSHKNARRMNCSLCRQFSDSSKANLLQHYKEAHGVNFEYEETVFPLFEEFISWKQKIEKETQALYVTNHGSSKTKSHTLIRYSCHRSGEFKRKGSNKRKLKRQGSNKIDAFCPASMKVTIKDQRCEVVFQKTHVGHEQELRHLSLTADEKQQIAAEIASNVPFDTIIERVRSSVNKESSRLRLLTKQDLYNIQNSLHNKRIMTASNNDPKFDECLNDIQENVTENDLFIDTDHIEAEILDVTSPNRMASSEKLFTDRKNQVFSEISAICEDVTGSEELEIIEKSLAYIKEALQKLRSQNVSDLCQTSEASENAINSHRQTSAKRIDYSTNALVVELDLNKM